MQGSTQNNSSSLFRSLITPRYHYPNLLDQVRAQITLIYALMGLVIAGFIDLVGIAARLQPMSQITHAQSQSLILGSTFLGLTCEIAIIILIHTGQLRIATLIAYLSLLASALVAHSTGVAYVVLIIVVLPLLYSGFIWQWRGTLITLAILEAATIWTSIRQAQGLLATDPPFSTGAIALYTALAVMTMAWVGIITGFGASALRRAMERSQNLAAQLRVSTEVVRQSSTLMHPKELCREAVKAIGERFGYETIQLYLPDNEHRFMVLAAAAGSQGAALLKDGYRIAIGSQDPVGRTALTGEQRISTYNPEAPHGTAHLPSIRSALTLPLVANDDVIGVFDIHSSSSDAFSPEIVESLGLLVSQLSVALVNAQTFERQQAELLENRRLFLEAQSDLREIQRLNQRLTGEAWESYLRARPNDIVGYTLSNNQLRQDQSWSRLLQEAANKRQPVVAQEGKRRVVAVPVELRGRTIGAIEVETDDSIRQSDALDMLQSISQRLALSIDNARLFEQSQELAQQELEVNAISARLQGVTNVNELLRTALAELSRALGASQASIRLGGLHENSLTVPNHNGNSGTPGTGKLPSLPANSSNGKGASS